MGTRRQTFTTGCTIAADGTGMAIFIAPAGVLHVDHVRLTVSSTASQPTATLLLNGADFEGSYTGGNDQSDTAYDMQAQETLECVWTRADPGARATLYVRGTQED